MSQPLDAAVSEQTYPVPADASEASVRSPLLTVGGSLGVVACVIGLLALLVGCAGFGKALTLGVVAAGLGVTGLAVSFVGAIIQKHRIFQETHILQALFVNVLGLIGGALEAAVAFNWRIFHK